MKVGKESLTTFGWEKKLVSPTKGTTVGRAPDPGCPRVPFIAYNCQSVNLVLYCTQNLLDFHP